MSKGAWGGLITNASPFAIPAGAAVEQVNLAADVAGQIYTRGGMRAVAFSDGSEGASALIDCHPYTLDGQSWLLCLNESGELVSLAGPAYGEEPSQPLEPQLTASGGMAASYTMRYVLDVAEDPPQPPPPDPNELISALSGGKAGTASWPYYLDANNDCAGEGKQRAFRGGRSGTYLYPASVSPSELCQP